MRPLLVRHGDDARLPEGEHTAAMVYTEMMIHVARDYPGIGVDIRTLRFSEILFFYNGLRAELREYSKPRK